MSLCRAAHPSMTSSSYAASFFRLAIASSAPSSASSSLPLRTFSSYPRLRVASKRELQTATTYRPHSLPAGGFPAPSLNGKKDDMFVVPEVNETRPPSMVMGGQRETVPVVKKGEAQEMESWSSPETNTSASSATTTSTTTTSTASPQAKPTPPEATTATTTTSSTTEPSKSRPKRKLRPRKAAMTLTPTAITQLRSLLSSPDPKLIRVGVKNRGCSGLAYHLEYVEKPGMFDEVVEQEGVKVLIDSKALFSIIGSEMDWLEDELSQKFVFRNPNIKEECGCGESFMV